VKGHPYLGCTIKLKIPIIGIGAPAKAFLPGVAQALATEIIFPPYYDVANAVGAVVGNVVALQTGQVFPCVEGALITGYYARAAHAQKKFASYQEALTYAKEELSRLARREVLAAGASDSQLDCQVKDIWEGMAEVIVTAIGKPGKA